MIHNKNSNLKTLLGPVLCQSLNLGIKVKKDRIPVLKGEMADMTANCTNVVGCMLYSNSLQKKYESRKNLLHLRGSSKKLKRFQKSDI